MFWEEASALRCNTRHLNSIRDVALIDVDVPPVFRRVTCKHSRAWPPFASHVTLPFSSPSCSPLCVYCSIAPPLLPYDFPQCGSVGHLTFQCRNHIQPVDAATPMQVCTSSCSGISSIAHPPMDITEGQGRRAYILLKQPGAW